MDGSATNGATNGATSGTSGEAVVLPGQRAEVPAAAGPVPLRLELLVHGVGGTTPEAMLESPHLKQITGDSMSGTYRRWPDQDAEQRPGDYAGDAVLEAYSWAKLTSGAASRALWLLLLPFMFANLVHWMRPPGAAGGRAANLRLYRAYNALARLLALSLTVLLTGAACEIAMDLAAWQCAANTACVAHHSWAVFALGGHGGWWGQPGRRLAVAALLPVAVLAGLGQVARMTWSSYERVRPMTAPRTDEAPIEMERDRFWYGVTTVGRLRPLHLAGGLLTVAWTALVPVVAHDRQAAPSRAWFGIALLVLLVALGALLLASLGTGADVLPPRALPAVAGALTVLVLGYAAWNRPEWSATGALPGAERGFAALLAGQLVLALALTGVAFALTRRGRADDPVAPVDPALTVPSPDPGAPKPEDEGFGGPNGAALRGLAGPATALLGLGLGALFSSGAALFTAQRLASGGGGALPQAVPLLVWHAGGTTLVLPVLVVVVARLAVPLLRERSALRPEVLEAYDEPRTTDSPRTGQITTKLAGARLTEAGGSVIGGLALVAAAQLCVALAGALVSGESLTAATADLGMVGSRLGELLQNLGGWLTTALVLGLVTLGRSAYSSPARRRTVGVLWDIGTFWPRAAHPLAPPCYAERAVPDIEARVRTWLDADPTRRLVLSAHSQGTVLAAAALWQLDPATRGRVALLTYGSPLRRLYGRFFPAYMGPDELMRLQRDMPRWDNLFRLTDPIGGPVRIPAMAGSPAVDQPALPDPLAFGRTEQYPILVPVNGHFDYRLDPRFLVARDALLTAITV
ncbi:hypothetical protein [Streptacidiphilus sp. MAP12-33]|uniref:hypothetical protein n=1 Tax=Streptacidiphilus sp. MAP12-33 TaxID=3156266 RepID=UPI0035194A23